MKKDKEHHHHSTHHHNSHSTITDRNDPMIGIKDSYGTSLNLNHHPLNHHLLHSYSPQGTQQMMQQMSGGQLTSISPY